MSEQLDICFKRHGGNAQSNEAFLNLRGKLTGRRALVYDHIAQQGTIGATADETSKALGLSTQTVSARFSELKKMKMVTKTGTRKTSWGNNAGVYCINNMEAGNDN